MASAAQSSSAATAAAPSASGSDYIVVQEHPDLLLPPHVLSKSPSRADGIDEVTEVHHRIFGCELIQEASILLQLPQVVSATAQTLFHRFLYRKSLASYDVLQVARVCVFVASKVEEEKRRVLDVFNVFHHMWQRRRNLHPQMFDIQTQLAVEWRENLIMMEALLLKELGFSMYNIMDHPHKYILYYIRVLEGSNSKSLKALSQRAWNYLNDSLRLDLMVRYPPETIACAAIYLAARCLAIKLPTSPPWYRLFGAEKHDIEAICDRILRLYNVPKVGWLGSLRPDATEEEKKSYGAPAASATETASAKDTATASATPAAAATTTAVAAPSATLEAPATTSTTAGGAAEQDSSRKRQRR